MRLKARQRGHCDMCGISIRAQDSGPYYIRRLGQWVWLCGECMAQGIRRVLVTWQEEQSGYR